MRTTIVAALLSLPLLALTLPAQDLAFKRAADYSEEKDGLAVLVSHKGKTVFERYANGHDADKAKHIWSGTKSFAPMMALVAEAEGLLKLDELVADTITEWADDPRKKKITIRHLLSFTSGISQKSSYSRSDIYKNAVMAETKTDPGKRFKYGSNHLRVFGELMKRKLATRLNTQQKNAPRDALAYLRQRILDPIGCEFGKWTRDKSKNPNLAYGAYVTARNWVKFGHLVLNKGRCGDRQVVPSDHLNQCFVGTRANPTYGLNWWLVGGGLHTRNAAVPKDTVAAKGLFGQMLYVIPSRDLVIVRFGKDRSRKGFSDAAFLGRLFGRGAARTDEASTRREPKKNGSADPKLVERAVQDYVEALYHAKPKLIERSVDPELDKIGAWRAKDSTEFRPAGKMTYKQLFELAGRWNNDGRQGKDLKFDIQVLDVRDVIASAKLTAKWGIDHMQLLKRDGKWKIVHVIWQSHPAAAKKTNR